MTEALVNVFLPMPVNPQSSASAAKERVAALVVATDADYAGAGDVLIEIKRRRKELDDERKKLVQPIDTARERVQALFRGPLLDLDECERIVKRKLVDYQNAQEALRRAEQAKADEAARKEREKLEAQARKAAEAGKVERAEALQERAAVVVPPIIQREAPKVAGVSLRPVWKFKIDDESQVPLEYRPVSEELIGRVVRALKGQTRIPGVTVWEEKTVAAGGGK